MLYTGVTAVLDQQGGRRPGWLAPLLLLSGLMFATLAWASGFQVLDVSTRLEDNIYWLDADLEYDLSTPSLEALDSGVPLTIELQIRILRARTWVWDELVSEFRQRFRLEYHALARQYLITNLNNGELATFPSRVAALRFLGRIRRLPLLKSAQLDPTEKYHGQLRTRLDIEALPAPLRPVAYLSPDWRLTSEWYQWPL